MYSHPYLVYLYSQMRQQELLQEFEKKKLIRLALQNRRDVRKFCRNIMDWMQARQPDIKTAGLNSFEQQHCVDTCSMATEA